MNKFLIIVDFLTAFIISGGGAILVNVMDNHGEITKSGVIVAVIFGLLSGAKNVRSFLALPPVNGNYKYEKPNLPLPPEP